MEHNPPRSFEAEAPTKPFSSFFFAFFKEFPHTFDKPAELNFEHWLWFVRWLAGNYQRFTPSNGRKDRWLAPRGDYELAKKGFTDGEPITYLTF